MGKSKPFTIYNYMIMEDGSKRLMSMIENAGTLNRKDTIFISEEQRQEFNDKMCINVSKVMSPLYASGQLSPWWYNNN